MLLKLQVSRRCICICICNCNNFEVAVFTFYVASCQGDTCSVCVRYESEFSFFLHGFISFYSFFSHYFLLLLRFSQVEVSLTQFESIWALAAMQMQLWLQRLMLLALWHGDRLQLLLSLRQKSVNAASKPVQFTKFVNSQTVNRPGQQQQQQQHLLLLLYLSLLLLLLYSTIFDCSIAKTQFSADSTSGLVFVAAAAAAAI